MRSLTTSVLAVIAAMAGGAVSAQDPAVSTQGEAARAPAAAQFFERTTAPGSFSVLAYHEARDDVRDYPDPFAVDSSALVAQFAWLRGNGYTPVSLDDILAARRGEKPLPPKAVLLSFDDGYRSFYTRVYPLLREFHYPALLAVVGSWIDRPPGAASAAGAAKVYGEKNSVPDASFPTWAELREMAASGLVEIASHTYELHLGAAANPQGNMQPAATARAYDAATGRYEDDAAWSARVRADLQRNSEVIERETGRRPRAMVWPYGAYNDELVRIAGELGMPLAFTLSDGANTPDVPLTALRRTLIEHNPPLGDFFTEVRGPLYPLPVRVVQISLDAVYDADPARQERNLSLLLDRMNVLKPTHVYLQATSDLDGNGIAEAAYFPNQHLPLRADLFNRVAWQLASRDDLKVFAVLPSSGLRLTENEIAEVYGDLARYAQFSGLAFLHDGRLAPEDAARFVKSTQRNADAARRWRGPLKIARGLVLEPHPSTDARGAASAAMAEFEASSDYIVMAIPPGWADAPLPRARIPRALPGNAAAAKLIYMQAAPRAGGASPAPGAFANRMARRMRELQSGGALNFGYGGDDFLHDDPPLVLVAPAMSLRENPLSAGAEEK